jgi:hypothetical protein
MKNFLFFLLNKISIKFNYQTFIIFGRYFLLTNKFANKLKASYVWIFQMKSESNIKIEIFYLKIMITNNTLLI